MVIHKIKMEEMEAPVDVLVAAAAHDTRSPGKFRVVGVDSPPAVSFTFITPTLIKLRPQKFRPI